MVVSLEKQQKYGFLVSECVAGDGLGADVGLIANDGCSLDGEIMGMFQYAPDKQAAQVSFQAYRFPHSASVYFTCGTPCTHKPRARRDTDEGSPATVEVFSGLFVNEADSLENEKEDEICIPQRNFAIGICIAGVILMVCVIAAIACILARRRNPKTYSRTGSSLYSGPYTNTGYSHTS
ncbi:Cuticlin-1 [Operophtera brumata]|uniref:Cuticlin-1 n=1 Tax=Operophtera brumata TaxID=104452 RepID=A0A0L7LVG6_OPEBR|nr:Cuticlin-1 [Operophtera brumata]